MHDSVILNSVYSRSATNQRSFHSEIESETLDDFASALHLMKSDKEHLRNILIAVESGDLGLLKSMGIRDSELTDLKLFLDKLVQTGFMDWELQMFAMKRLPITNNHLCNIYFYRLLHTHTHRYIHTHTHTQTNKQTDRNEWCFHHTRIQNWSILIIHCVFFFIILLRGQ